MAVGTTGTQDLGVGCIPSDVMVGGQRGISASGIYEIGKNIRCTTDIISIRTNGYKTAQESILTLFFLLSTFKLQDYFIDIV